MWTVGESASAKCVFKGNRISEDEALTIYFVQVFGVLAPMAPRMDSNFCGAGKSFFFACKPKYKVY